MLIWIRFSIPRLQVDQLMAFAWKILIPLGLAVLALGFLGPVLTLCTEKRGVQRDMQHRSLLGATGGTPSSPRRSGSRSSAPC